MTRNVSCVMKPGNSVVPSSLCSPSPPLPGQESDTSGLIVSDLLDLATSTSCYIGCDQDCTISSWSDWSNCKNTNCHPDTTSEGA